MGYTSGFSLSCMVFFLISVSVSFDSGHSTVSPLSIYLCLTNAHCLLRLSTRNSTSRVHWTKMTTITYPTTTSLTGQTTSVMLRCLPSTLRLEENIFQAPCPRCPLSRIVSRVFISWLARQIHRHAFGTRACYVNSVKACCVNSSVGYEQAFNSCAPCWI